MKFLADIWCGANILVRKGWWWGQSVCVGSETLGSRGSCMSQKCCCPVERKQSNKNMSKYKPIYLSLMYTSPPMTHTKSGVRTNGAHSLLKPCKRREKWQKRKKRERTMRCVVQVSAVQWLLGTIMYLMFPRKCPKSMWKRLPDVVTMILSLWRSPIPYGGV